MKVLVATHPYAGHYNPTQPVVKELVRRGHEVVWMTGPTYGYKATSSGARFVPMSKGHLIDDALEHSLPPGRFILSRVTAYLKRLMLDRIPAQVRDYQKVCETFPADVLLVDYCTHGANIFYDLTGIPYATLGINPLVTLDPEIPPWGFGEQPPRTFFGRCWNWLRHQLSIFLFMTSLTAVLNGYRVGLGLAPRSRRRAFFDDIRSPLAHLQMTTPAFEFPRSQLPGNVKFVGPLMPAYDPRGFAYPDWWGEMLAHPREKVVHVTQGTVATNVDALIKPTIRALADRDDLLVVVTGRNLYEVFRGLPVPEGVTKEALLDRIDMPPNVRVAPFVPHLKLLPHVGAMVTNAGYNGVLTALRCGVPLVCAGKSEDKADVSSRVQYAGAGVDLRTARPTAAAVRDAVLTIVGDAAFRDNAARIRDDFALHDPAGEAVDELERLACLHRMPGSDDGEGEVEDDAETDVDDTDSGYADTPESPSPISEKAAGEEDEQLWF